MVRAPSESTEDADRDPREAPCPPAHAGDARDQPRDPRSGRQEQAGAREIHAMLRHAFAMIEDHDERGGHEQQEEPDDAEAGGAGGAPRRPPHRQVASIEGQTYLVIWSPI